MPAARGAADNLPNRFAALTLEPDPDDEPRPVRTQFLQDASQSVITTNTSPDVPFDASINPYRGCEHGCAYCFARPTHEYLGFSAGLDFESRIVVKEDAAALLRNELLLPSWQPRPLAMSTVTDCYQPVERRLGLTRRCLAVLADLCNPVGIITKNHLVTRDADLLADLASDAAAHVSISIATLDPDLAKTLEPRASAPSRRLAAIRELTTTGVPVSVLMAPCIPGLTDHEIPAVFAAVAEAGALDAHVIPLRLPGAVAPIFEQWLTDHRPGSRDRVLSRVRSMRGGQLNDPRFGSRFRGEGPFAESMRSLARIAHRRADFPGLPALSSASFRPAQAELF